MGDHAAALPLNRQALEIRRAALGEDHPTCEASMSSLAKAHEALGDYAAARPLLERVTEIRRATLGEGHPDYARESVQPGWSASSAWGTTPPL